MENDVVNIVTNNNYKYITYKKLNELGIKNVFSLKPFDFNFKFQSKEDNQKEFQKICKMANFNYEKLCRPRQDHTSEVRIIKNNYGINIPELTNVDAIITNQKDVPLAITTADCLPIIIYDEGKKVIAAIHAGWKGSLNGILKNTIDTIIKSFKSDISNLLFFFGPSICQKCFSVSKERYDMFMMEYGYLEKAHELFKEENNIYYIDIAGLNETILLNLGIKKANIYNANICTLENKDIIHSYRGRKDNDFGLGVTIVSL